MAKNKESIKVIRDAIIVAIIAQIVQIAFLNLAKIPANMASNEGWVPYTITGIFSITFGIIIYFILRRREAVRRSNHPLAIVIGGRTHPAEGLATTRIDKYNVHWDLEIGWNDSFMLSRIDGNARIRAYASGPFCPKDHCELTSMNLPTLLGGKKHIWRCAKCEAIYNRPKDVYGQEKDEVEKVAMADYEEWVKSNPSQH